MSESLDRNFQALPNRQISPWLAPGPNSGSRSARDWRHDHLEAVFERTRNAMLIVNNDRVFVDCNQASGLLLECPHEETVGKRIDDFTPDEDRDLLEAVWPQFVSGNTGGEGTWVLCTARSARITVEYSATPNFVPGLHLSILMKQTEGPLSVPATTGGRSLSPREREILVRIAVGESGPQIAAELFISPDTVRTHLQHVLVKLGAQTRPHAIALALQRGEITAEEFASASP
jgi:DNA-binding CsgD family transcriptional regulator